MPKAVLGGLSPTAFLERSAAVLAPLGLHAVTERLLSSVGDRVTRLAYFRNPHIVFTLRLSSLSDEGRVRLPSLWLRERHTFLAGAGSYEGSDLERQAEVEGGVHDGRSAHVEAYMDVANDGREYGLHRSGRSFRVRVSRSQEAGRADDVRILVVLTRSPVTGAALLPLDPGRHWRELDAEEFPAFRPLVSEASWLADAEGMPSVAKCFVIFTNSWHAAVEGLEAVASESRNAPLRVVTRNTKISTRVTLRPWNQEGRSGVMQADWAYIVLDEVEITPSVEITRGLGNRGEAWHRVYQVELEVGPSPGLLKPAASLIKASRRLLRELGIEAVPACGRKYHRLLLDAGVGS